MSVLDMFASALGAFIMVAIILFPFYQKNRPIKEKQDAAVAELKRTQEDVEKTEAEAEKFEQQNNDIKAEIRKVQLAQVELNRCKQGRDACLIEAGATFLLVKIEWNDSVDVDLHVTDPQGNEFSFEMTNKNGTDFKNSQGRLSIDTVTGPGIEVWQIPVASPGAYKIEYVMNSEPGRVVAVNGLFFDKLGKKQLPDKIIGNGNLRVLAGIIEVASDGRLALHQ
jgi:predicted secreted protein